MSLNLFELKQQQKAALDKAETLLGANDHVMTAPEAEGYQAAMDQYHAVGKTIEAREKQNTLRAFFRDGKPLAGGPLLGSGDDGAAGLMNPVSVSSLSAETRSPEYARALHGFLKSGGKAHGYELTLGADGVGGYYVPGSELYTQQRRSNGMSAAMYEGASGGSDGAGGYAINIPTIQQIVPLAMPDLGIFDASLVVPTATDIKIPQQASFGESALKSESSGTIATFGGDDPTLGQITLSAYMSGALRLASWELLQDVEMFQSFIVDDLLKGQRILEGQLLATGTGSGQAQGVFGNTGTGTGTAYELTGTAATDAVTLINSLYDVVSTLKAAYQPNASFIMARSTALAIRKAQTQTNLFVPVVTVDPDGTTRILGRPVYFDVNAPALPTATSAGVLPILYGDFKAGNIIGVRGGAGINVKILDQPWAAQGQLGILAYRRLDSRVRLVEAIQAVKVSHV
jgi:HK97 family phage major capsid protein